MRYSIQNPGTPEEIIREREESERREREDDTQVTHLLAEFRASVADAEAAMDTTIRKADDTRRAARKRSDSYPRLLKAITTPPPPPPSIAPEPEPSHK